MLALVWTLLTRQVLGVPHDLAAQARRMGGSAQTDVEHLARIHAARYVHYWQSGSFFFVAVTAFLITMLVVLSFVFWIEMAQGLFLLITPVLVINALHLRAAYLVLADHGTGEALHQLMKSLRIYVQVIGFVFIMLSALLGMMDALRAFQHG